MVCKNILTPKTHNGRKSQEPPQGWPQKKTKITGTERWKRNFGTLEEHLARPKLRHQSRTPVPESVCDQNFGGLELLILQKAPKVASLKLRYLEKKTDRRRFLICPKGTWKGRSFGTSPLSGCRQTLALKFDWPNFGWHPKLRPIRFELDFGMERSDWLRLSWARAEQYKQRALLQNSFLKNWIPRNQPALISPKKLKPFSTLVVLLRFWCCLFC